ncbi:MAG: hypothetical protein VB133_07570 [Anaeromusa sp.]|uniref:hypothetical protein n=1 Tax=Anaeromusa sp. TaxID=1872520 RepID=UPI002B1F90A2|nr:hypothetical protein [Anaeromusa sp.]MEA4834975.1 hypothetical protein [Anaeromusa sp.]
MKIGKYFYGEWIVPIGDYYSILKPTERNYEIYLPAFIALVVTGIYYDSGCILPALLKLRDILPASLAILIGFSITSITIWLSSNNKNIDDVKNRSTEDRIISGKLISIYQWVLIMFIYVLLVQIFLLLMVFFTAFILRIYSGDIFMSCLLFIEVYLTLHILFLLIRSITNFYFVFFRKPEES